MTGLAAEREHIMAAIASSPVILTRKLAVETDRGEVSGYIRVHIPVRNGREWGCSHDIVLPDFELEEQITWGADSDHALSLTLQTIPARLQSYIKLNEGKVKLFGKKLTEDRLKDSFSFKWLGDSQ